MPTSPAERQALAQAAGRISAARNPGRGHKLRAARVESYLQQARALHPAVDESTPAGRGLIQKAATDLEVAHMARMRAAALTARRRAREAAERAALAEAALADEYPDAG